MSRLVLSTTFLFIAIATPVPAADDGFKPIFDGKTLTGWSAPDMKYWSVRDGAITAHSSAEVPCTKNQFLVWQRGTLDDFELKLKYRIRGGPSANSGIQIRSQIKPDGHAEGYQADLDRFGPWLGAIYDEHTGRRVLAKRGQRTRIAADGKRQSEILDVSRLKVEKGGWNDYHITARGAHITVRINGTVTSEVIDEQKGHRDLWGKLALQIHSGPPMTVQFKDIQLKRHKLTDGRKKIVLIAGAPSHASGEHEFNAGIKLLAKRLHKVETVAVANYHDNGWPKDATALDNADAIVFYADGQGRHPIMRHFEDVDKLAARGVGVMCMHYAVHVAPGKEGTYFQKWMGGFYETGFSSNPHWNAALKLHKNHPIVNGVKAETIHDEWYFCIRFRPDMAGVESILQASPSDKTRSLNGYPRKQYPHIVAASGRMETLMWAVERKDGGRGVGFTGGHWHRNWAYDTQRRVVLNAMLWVAGAKVPEGGVSSEPVSEAELNANLDRKRRIKHVRLPE